MKSVLSAMEREWKLIFRDGITLYLTLSPAALALVFLLIFGSMREADLSLAVDRNLPEEALVKLEAVADLEHADSLERLKERVSGADSVAGVALENGKIKLIVEGNEPRGFAESRQSLVSAALSAAPMAYATETVEAGPTLAYTVSLSCILLLALFIGGSALGLSGVNERESGVLRAVSVSPMTLGSYLLSKTVPALLLGMIGVSACALITGRAETLPPFLLLALCSVFVSGVIVLLMIAFADNQIAAVGVLKIIMPLFLVVGASSAFVPEGWRFLYYPFPMYWQYAAIDRVIANGDAGFQFLMILATGLLWLIPVMVFFLKRVKIKEWRE